MASPNMVILDEDQTRFVTILEALRSQSNAKFAFLLDKNGQQIAAVGELAGVDATAMASLAAGNVAATEGLAELVGEDSFSTLYHEGRRDSIHMSLVGKRFIVLVSFDQLSSLGLVRLRVEQHTPLLVEAVEITMNRSSEQLAAGIAASSMPEITDEDIDALFG